MISAPVIALLGFGEVGQILAGDLKSRSVSAYDPLFDDPASGPSLALNSAVTAADNTGALAAGADIIISCVTAAQTEAAAQSVAGALKPQAWFLDLNSASPGAKRAAAECIAAAGGRYVEASVMSPAPPKRLASPILLGGPHADAFLPLAHALGFSDVSVFSHEYGPTAAVKMCRSVMVKGIEALLSEALICARTHGVESAVLDSLVDLLPGPDWPKLSRYMISRSLEHGARRAEEMREAARTVAEAGLAPLMSAAIAQRQQWAAAQRSAAQFASLGAMLDALAQAAESEPGDVAAR